MGREVIQKLFFHSRVGEVAWARRHRREELGAPAQGARSAEPCPGRRAQPVPNGASAGVEEGWVWDWSVVQLGGNL